MRIILDAMGGDNAPLAPVMGAVQAAKDFGSQIVLVGKQEEIVQCLRAEGIDSLPDGIEIVNASRPDFENNMAAYYAQYYDLIPVAGSDNHSAEKQKRLAGLSFETPIRDEADFVARVMAREAKIFTLTPGA